MKELRKEYSSREEFEADRRRLWKAGGWFVRTKVAGEDKSKGRGSILPEMGSDFPWQFAIPILAIIAVVAIVRWRRRKSTVSLNERVSVVYGRVGP